MMNNEVIKSQLIAMTIFDANNKMMSVNECAEFLDINRRTVVNRIESGQIIAHNETGHYAIPKMQFVDGLIIAFQKESKKEIAFGEDFKQQVKKSVKVCLKEIILNQAS